MADQDSYDVAIEELEKAIAIAAKSSNNSVAERAYHYAAAANQLAEARAWLADVNQPHGGVSKA